MVKLRMLRSYRYLNSFFKGFLFFMFAGYFGLGLGILLWVLDLLGVRVARWLHVYLFGFGVLYTFLFSNLERRLLDVEDHRSVSDLLLKGAIIVLIWGLSTVDGEDRN